MIRFLSRFYDYSTRHLCFLNLLWVLIIIFEFNVETIAIISVIYHRWDILLIFWSSWISWISLFTFVDFRMNFLDEFSHGISTNRIEIWSLRDRRTKVPKALTKLGLLLFRIILILFVFISIILFLFRNLFIFGFWIFGASLLLCSALGPLCAKIHIRDRMCIILGILNPPYWNFHIFRLLFVLFFKCSGFHMKF